MLEPSATDVRGLKKEICVTLALTLTLSPREREQRGEASRCPEIKLTIAAFWFFGASSDERRDNFATQEAGEWFSLSPGERAGVRAGVNTEFVSISDPALIRLHQNQRADQIHTRGKTFPPARESPRAAA